MRRLFCILIVCLALGCRNQSMPLSNPFMAPNRVPPPATRTLLPGTAQPYYPGDPVPNSPAIGVPAPVTPPGATFGPTPTYTAPQTTPTTPPGGWSTGPVSSAPTSNWYSGAEQASAQAPQSTGAEAAVQVPTDTEGLRFAGTMQPQVTPTSYEATPLAASQADQFTPVQDSVASAQYIQPAPNSEQREVTIRQIASSELPDPVADSSITPTRAGRDGFRPQGSSRERAEEIDRPELTPKSNPVTPVQEPLASYGFDPSYRWLRGHLAYTPTTSQWSLQYIAPGAIADSFGGSVPITNPQVLGAMQPGELVSVEGRLEMLQLDEMSVVPAYTITVLQRQQQAVR